MEGAQTHLEQFITLVTPFKVNTASFSSVIQHLLRFQQGLTQAQDSLETLLPPRDKELKITISDQQPAKDPFFTPDMLKWILAAIVLSLPAIWMAKWFMDWVTGQ